MACGKHFSWSWRHILVCCGFWIISQPGIEVNVLILKSDWESLPGVVRKFTWVTRARPTSFRFLVSLSIFLLSCLKIREIVKKVCFHILRYNSYLSWFSIFLMTGTRGSSTGEGFLLVSCSPWKFVEACQVSLYHFALTLVRSLWSGFVKEEASPGVSGLDLK